jgi:autotransporter passenger strand-loop-strand repeat protein
MSGILGGLSGLLSGIVDTGLDILGGSEFVETNTASNTTISSGGLLSLVTTNVVSPATAVASLILAGGSEIVGTAADDVSATVDSGGVLLLSGGTATGTIVQSGGLMIVLSGGTALAPTGGGSVLVEAGGTVLSASLSGLGAVVGPVVLSAGSSAIGLSLTLPGYTVSSGVSEIITSGGSELSQVIASGGSLTVSLGGVANSETVRSGGTVTLLGGTASAANVAAGASVLVGNGGVAADLTLGGIESVTSGGLASGGMVISGGSVTVGSGTVLDVTVGSAGLLSLGAGATGSGLVISGGVLSVNSGAAVSDAITFVGSSGTLVLNNNTPVMLSGFGNGVQETVILSGLPVSSGATLSAVGSALMITDGAVSATLDLSSLAANAHAQLGSIGGVLEVSTPCFAAGTRILTPSGEVPVEMLVPGDTVVTVRDDGPATRQVVWTGRRATDIRRHPHPERVRPVRILAGAFGAGVPERDVRVSPNHAIYIDGALFEAIRLVNGVSIIQETMTNTVTYHHIELDGHDIVLAEGLPAESFLDTGNRDMFAASQGVVQLFPGFRTAENAPTCVPLHRTGPALDRARARLSALAARFAARPLAAQA